MSVNHNGRGKKNVGTFQPLNSNEEFCCHQSSHATHVPPIQIVWAKIQNKIWSLNFSNGNTCLFVFSLFIAGQDGFFAELCEKLRVVSRKWGFCNRWLVKLNVHFVRQRYLSIVAITIRAIPLERNTQKIFECTCLTNHSSKLGLFFFCTEHFIFHNSSRRL